MEFDTKTIFVIFIVIALFFVGVYIYCKCILKEEQLKKFTTYLLTNKVNNISNLENTQYRSIVLWAPSISLTSQKGKIDTDREKNTDVTYEDSYRLLIPTSASGFIKTAFSRDTSDMLAIFIPQARESKTGPFNVKLAQLLGPNSFNLVKNIIDGVRKPLIKTNTYYGLRDNNSPSTTDKTDNGTKTDFPRFIFYNPIDPTSSSKFVNKDIVYVDIKKTVTYFGQNRRDVYDLIEPKKTATSYNMTHNGKNALLNPKITENGIIRLSASTSSSHVSSSAASKIVSVDNTLAKYIGLMNSVNIDVLGKYRYNDSNNEASAHTNGNRFSFVHNPNFHLVGIGLIDLMGTMAPGDNNPNERDSAQRASMAVCDLVNTYAYYFTYGNKMVYMDAIIPPMFSNLIATWFDKETHNGFGTNYQIGHYIQTLPYLFEPEDSIGKFRSFYDHYKMASVSFAKAGVYESVSPGAQIMVASRSLDFTYASDSISSDKYIYPMGNKGTFPVQKLSTVNTNAELSTIVNYAKNVPIGGFEFYSNTTTTADNDLSKMRFNCFTGRKYKLNDIISTVGAMSLKVSASTKSVNDYYISSYKHNYYVPWIGDLRTKFVILSFVRKGIRGACPLGFRFAKYNGSDMDPNKSTPINATDITVHYANPYPTGKQYSSKRLFDNKVKPSSFGITSAVESGLDPDSTSTLGWVGYSNTDSIRNIYTDSKRVPSTSGGHTYYKQNSSGVRFYSVPNFTHVNHTHFELPAAVLVEFPTPVFLKDLVILTKPVSYTSPPAVNSKGTFEISSKNTSSFRWSGTVSLFNPARHCIANSLVNDGIFQHNYRTSTNGQAQAEYLTFGSTQPFVPSSTLFT